MLLRRAGRALPRVLEVEPPAAHALPASVAERPRRAPAARRAAPGRRRRRGPRRPARPARATWPPAGRRPRRGACARRRGERLELSLGDPARPRPLAAEATARARWSASITRLLDRVRVPGDREHAGAPRDEAAPERLAARAHRSRAREVAALRAGRHARGRHAERDDDVPFHVVVATRFAAQTRMRFFSAASSSSTSLRLAVRLSAPPTWRSRSRNFASRSSSVCALAERLLDLGHRAPSASRPSIFSSIRRKLSNALDAAAWRRAARRRRRARACCARATSVPFSILSSASFSFIRSSSSFILSAASRCSARAFSATLGLARDALLLLQRLARERLVAALQRELGALVPLLDARPRARRPSSGAASRRRPPGRPRWWPALICSSISSRFSSTSFLSSSALSRSELRLLWMTLPIRSKMPMCGCRRKVDTRGFPSMLGLATTPGTAGSWTKWCAETPAGLLPKAPPRSRLPSGKRAAPSRTRSSWRAPIDSPSRASWPATTSGSSWAPAGCASRSTGAKVNSWSPVRDTTRSARAPTAATSARWRATRSTRSWPPGAPGPRRRGRRAPSPEFEDEPTKG